MALTQGRINLLLAALVLTLGALLFFEPGKDPVETQTAVSAQSPDRIRRITRTGPGEETLTLERQGPGWAMLAPYRVAADAARVRGLLAIAGEPSRARFPAVPGELAGFGLDPPGIRLELDDEQLGFGRTEPVHFRRYVLVGDHVHLIDDYGYRHLIAAPEAFVSRRLLEPGAEVVAINGPGLELQRLTQDQGRAEPVTAPDPQRMAHVWRETQALEVRKAPTDARAAAFELRLRGRDKPLVFLQAPEQPDLLVRPDLGLGYRVPADAPLLQVLQEATASPGPPP